MPFDTVGFNRVPPGSIAAQHPPPELEAWAVHYAHFSGRVHCIRAILQAHFDLMAWELCSGRVTPALYQLESECFAPLRHAAEDAIQDNDIAKQQSVLYFLFEYKNKRKRRLFDRLLHGEYCSSQFGVYFDVFKRSVAMGWVSDHMSLTILTQTPLPGRSLLHELLLLQAEARDTRNDAFYLKHYLEAVDRLRGLAVLSHQAYMQLFTTENRGGFSVMHQAINAPNLAIARVFMAWFKENPYFSSEDRCLLVHYKSQVCENPGQGARRAPKRVHGKEGAKEINAQMTQWKKTLSRASERVSSSNLSMFRPVAATTENDTMASWIHSWVPSSLSMKGHS